MKKIFFSWALMAVTVVFMTACATKSETNEVNNFRIKRGTNLSHWLSQNNEDRGEARRLHIQEDDFARLDSLGFDFVRIPIDEVASTTCAPSSTCTSSVHTISMP